MPGRNWPVRLTSTSGIAKLKVAFHVHEEDIVAVGPHDSLDKFDTIHQGKYEVKIEPKIGRASKEVKERS